MSEAGGWQPGAAAGTAAQGECVGDRAADGAQAGGDVDALRREVRAAIAAARPALKELCEALYADPELAFVEHRAAARVAAALESAGYACQVGAYGLDTAIRAELPGPAGREPLTVTLCAEYDALPGIGHACGHNIIATAAVAAAVGLAAVGGRAGLRPVVLGTPAEEHGGGKALMLRAGAWDDAAISLMVHPAPRDSWPSAMVMQAVHRLRVEFTGRASHAAAAPELGINAADAATLAQVALGLLRQQVRDGARLGAFVSHGGEVTNIIPAHTALDIEVRERTTEDLAQLRARVLRCCEGAALATGCDWTWCETEPLYADLRQDSWLVERFAAYLGELGRPVDPGEPPYAGGSTDMGNVSHVVPSLHPPIGVAGATGPIHTEAFAQAAGGPGAIEAALDAGVALALTALDAALDPAVRRGYQAALAARRRGQEDSVAQGQRHGQEGTPA